MSEKTSENPKETVVESEETPVENSKELNQLANDISKEIEHVENEENATGNVEEHLDNYEKVATVVTRVMAREFRGPIPAPDILAEYENISPGFADRIISMAERQSQHRQEIEKTQVKAESRDSLLGVIFAFLLGGGSLTGCVLMVSWVPNSVGAICGAVLGVTGISAIVGTFLKNTRKQSKNAQKEN